MVFLKVIYKSDACMSCLSIVVAGKAMVPPVDLVYLEKIIKNISNRNFSLKLISVDAECFKLSVDMYFDHKRSLVACTGRVNCNICVKIGAKIIINM